MSMARVWASKKDNGSSELSAMGGKKGRVSTSVCAAMYSRGPTPEIINEAGTPRRGARRSGWMMRCDRGDGGRTCDGFSTVNDCQHGECISDKGTILGGRKLAVCRTSFGMVVLQVLSQVPKHVTETKRSEQV